MAREINYEVIEKYGNVRGEADRWGITVSKTKWGENPPTIDIRKTNFAAGIMGKGVSLTDHEVDNVVDILLNNDFGSVEAIEAALQRRKSRTTYDELKPEGVIEGEFKEVE